MSKQKSTHQRPNHIVRDMYLEINNIAQGINIGIFVLVHSTPGFYDFQPEFYSTPLFALASLFISVIFWARYYFDTELLDRSFTVLSAVWFFGYLITQGISISMVAQPVNWLISTAVFLFFGAGFYALNLWEIRRKRKVKILSLKSNFIVWQWKRMIELLILSALCVVGRYIFVDQPSSAFLVSIFAFAVAIWQLVVTHDYRKYQFIETGI
jgi:hypothetical protein